MATGARFVSVAWLTRLRWVGLVGLAVLTAVGPALRFSPPLLAVVVVIVAAGATNLALQRSSHAPVSDHWIAAILGVDTLLLTGLLAVSGGDANPFALVYVFPVVLGALTVRPSLTWALFAATTAGYASLFVVAPSDLHDHGPQAMRAHLAGMFVAYVLTAGLMAFAVGRVRASKDAADRQLDEARGIAERAERVAALATLAAGAAHELGSPLSTILVACRELERGSTDPRAGADLALIRDEVLRCQEIITLLSADVGAGIGEAARTIALRDLVDEALDGLGADPVVVDASEAEVNVPVGLVAQLVRRLVGNARDASAPDADVRVEATVDAAALAIAVIDRGSGIPADVLARVTEPFFTTKPPGSGRGLGLFFVQSVVTQLGGDLHIASEVGSGTTVTVRLPQGGAA